MNKGDILYVEDDQTLSMITCDNLEMKGYSVDHCEDGVIAFESFMHNSYDLCILDVMLPRMDGFTLAKKIRAVNQAIPIIFLTARSTQKDKNFGLQQGGDDYITKPYSIEELILKMDIFLKRSKITFKEIATNKEIMLGHYYFSHENLTLTIDGHSQNLTHREALLLNFLVDQIGKIVRREEILMAVWGNDQFFASRSVDVFISRLRKLLNRDPLIRIENIHNVGYRLTVGEG